MKSIINKLIELNFEKLSMLYKIKYFHVRCGCHGLGKGEVNCLMRTYTFKI